MTVSVKKSIPFWVFTTAWLPGHCRIDDGACEYQVSLKANRAASGFPDVTYVERSLQPLVEVPTTAEELWGALSELPEFGCYDIRVKCRSAMHGELECGHE